MRLFAQPRGAPRGFPAKETFPSRGGGCRRLLIQHGFRPPAARAGGVAPSAGRPRNCSRGGAEDNASHSQHSIQPLLSFLKDNGATGMYFGVWKAYNMRCLQVLGRALSPLRSYFPRWKIQLLLGYACSVTQSCLHLSDSMDRSPPKLLCPWDFPSKNTGVGCPFLLQGIKPVSAASPALAGEFFTTSDTWEAPFGCGKLERI